MSASTRWLVGVGVAVAAIVVVGVVVAAAGGRVRTYPEGSPERTVQQYLEAVSRHDAAAAYEYLDDDLAERCDDFRPQDPISSSGRDGVRAALEETTHRDGIAYVRVKLTESYGDSPFDGGESTHTQSFELTQRAEGWRFTESPWPLYCPPPARRLQ
jgi:hypothetical protein